MKKPSLPAGPIEPSEYIVDEKREQFQIRTYMYDSPKELITSLQYWMSDHPETTTYTSGEDNLCGCYHNCDCPTTLVFRAVYPTKTKKPEKTFAKQKKRYEEKKKKYEANLEKYKQDMKEWRKFRRSENKIKKRLAEYEKTIRAEQDK